MAGGKGQLPSHNLVRQKKFHLVRKFLSKNTKVGAKNITILGQSKGKMEILRTHNVVCRKIATFCLV